METNELFHILVIVLIYSVAFKTELLEKEFEHIIFNTLDFGETAWACNPMGWYLLKMNGGDLQHYSIQPLAVDWHLQWRSMSHICCIKLNDCIDPC